MTKRLESLDALRGFDMLFISGLSGLLIALCTLVGAPECWLAEQMRHTAWTGLHHHDTIFPLFLFMAGVSWPFSLASQRAKGASNGKILLKLAKRAVIFTLFAAIFGGLLTFDWKNIRYLDVLTTIGVCGGISAAIYMFVPDLVEYGHYATGERQEGICFSMQTFVTKLTGAIVASFSLVLLSAAGFSAADADPVTGVVGEAAGRACWAVFTLVPVIGAVLGAFILIKWYKLRGADVQLMSRCNNGEISREECEKQLTPGL